MSLLIEIQKRANEQENLSLFLENFNIQLENRQVTMESIHGVLDRISHMLSKNYLNPTDQSSIAKTLAALMAIKKNINSNQGPKLKDIIDKDLVNDYAKELENAIPGTTKKLEPLYAQIINDLAGNKSKSAEIIKDLRNLDPRTLDDATRHEPEPRV